MVRNFSWSVGPFLAERFPGISGFVDPRRNVDSARHSAGPYSGDQSEMAVSQWGGHYVDRGMRGGKLELDPRDALVALESPLGSYGRGPNGGLETHFALAYPSVVT